MANITYLMGAGASAGKSISGLDCTVPLAKDLATSIRAIANSLDLILGSGTVITQIRSRKEFGGNLRFDLFELADNASKHKTIDTYAKKLFALDRMGEFYQLKRTLSAYFSLYQLSVNGRCDERYDSFWASIIGKKYRHLPDNVRILTWNYDSQLEISFADYCPDGSIESAIDILNINNNDSEFQTVKKRNQFGIYKLNGTANRFLDYSNKNISHVHFSNHYVDDYNRENVELIIKQYDTLCNVKTFAPSIRFAWEHIDKPEAPGEVSFIDEICPEILATHVLVIIGYSFPFFNRDVDRKLFSNMKFIQKIYVQDKNPRPIVESLKAVYRGLETTPIEPIEYLDNQFFLPHEL